MAVNLKTSTIHLYYKNDFSLDKVKHLNTALKKGKHHDDLVDYFPKDVSVVIEEKFKKAGINEAINSYKNLRNSQSAKYNFNNIPVINLAVKWITNGNLMGAMKLLETLKEYDSLETDIYTWLAVAYKKNGNLKESDANFARAFILRPNDYLATLWGKQHNQKVIFKLNDFDGAEQISLMGEFTNWTKNAIAMTKHEGVWTCEVRLPKGTNLYKFRVNQEDLTDKLNIMYTGTGPDMYSVIFVW